MEKLHYWTANPGTPEDVFNFRCKVRHLFDTSATRPAFAELNKLFPDDQLLRVTLDLEEVCLLSSDCLSQLILLKGRVERSGGKLSLYNISEVPYQLFRTTSFDRRFHISRNREEALAHVQPPATKPATPS